MNVRIMFGRHPLTKEWREVEFRRFRYHLGWYLSLKVFAISIEFNPKWDKP